MLQAARYKDLCSGHYCYPPRPNNQASTDVFVNKRGAHRVTDNWAPHCCGTCHGGQTASGSNTVFINSKSAARVTDPVNCGSVIMTGSENVFIGTEYVYGKFKDQENKPDAREYHLGEDNYDEN